jgi:hypothetical protein
MLNKELPKITFGIIVLNGAPFVHYCLRSLYPFAHEIIVVEGGHEDAHSVCTPDGHSIDGTLETLYKFKEEEDPENKLKIIVKDGFWQKKDELGNDRTHQSRAYAQLATGDYLWQIDIDEFYKEEDMVEVITMLQNDPTITTISFHQKSFWGSINYISDGIYLRKNKVGWHRIFKWQKGYSYLTHEPPTVINEKGIDLRDINWINGRKMARKGIFMYHYSLLFPWQVEQKVKVYLDEKPKYLAKLNEWAENNYFKLNNPYRVHNIYWIPSWLIRFKGEHPTQIKLMMEDINQKKINVTLRKNDDVEALIDLNTYKLNIFLLKVQSPLKDALFQLKRIKNIPNRIRKILAKINQ